VGLKFDEVEPFSGSADPLASMSMSQAHTTPSRPPEYLWLSQ
jgi:hypothetical protein